MSLVDTGVGYIRGRRRSGSIGNSNLVISSIGGWEERAALFLLVKRKLNHGGHGSREFALTSCNCATNGSLDK